jgi:hypothetical protein
MGWGPFSKPKPHERRGEKTGLRRVRLVDHRGRRRPGEAGRRPRQIARGRPRALRLSLAAADGRDRHAYRQSGTMLTPNHGHTAFMRGMLAVALMVFAFPYDADERWHHTEKYLRVSFWATERWAYDDDREQSGSRRGSVAL